MNVTRLQILGRGLRHRCPNCGAPTFFEQGSYFNVAPVCSRCGMVRNKDEAAFLGSTSVNYGVSVFGVIIPGLAIAYCYEMPTAWMIGVAAAGAMLVPLLLFRPSKSWWFMLYYLSFPGHLPANWAQAPTIGRPPDE